MCNPFRRPAYLTARNCWLAFAFIVLAHASVHAQSSPLPNAKYYSAFRDFYRADYRSAGKDFTRGARTAYQQGSTRFLDSICYWTMAGECHYHLGNYAQAIQMYEQSLNLYLAYQQINWQGRIKLPPAIQPDNTAVQRARINWGRPTRNATIPRLPDSFSMLFGRLDVERTFAQGGVVANPEMRPVNLNEVMRCTALALYRRQQIKGPTAKYDPFTVKLVNGLKEPSAGNGTLFGSYNGVLLGIALASMEEWDQASAMLTRSLQFNGNMDHPLTPVALLELARIGVQTEKQDTAARFALEASYSAAVFYQYDLIEEALGLGTTIHLLKNKSAYPPLQPAIVWAAKEKARLLQTSLIVRLAECLAEAGDTTQATSLLQQTGRLIRSRNSLAVAVVSARIKYIRALIEFSQGQFSVGMTSLNAALNHYQNGSFWLYQLRLADQLVVGGNIGQRHADLLYGALLHDPTDLQWKMDPMEAIAFLASNHVAPMERWFDIVVARKDMDRALNIAELIRRHRFFSQLPLGGRLMAFRWVMQAPEEALSLKAQGQRTNFLNRFSQYRELRQKAASLRTQLLTLPIQPEAKSDAQREQAKLFKSLQSVTQLQEAMLASFALRREPAELAFPPQYQFSQFRKSIGQDQAALVSLTTPSGYHLFFVTQATVTHLGVAQKRSVERGVQKLLKELGLIGSALEFETLQSDRWKEVATTLKEQLFADRPDASWKKIRELVIVPDGMLWYMPFEVLPIGQGKDAKPLAEVVDIRYSPTLFLAYQPQRPHRRLARTVVVTAPMHSHDKGELSANAFQQLVAEMPTAVQIDHPLRTPSNLVGSLLDLLVVWGEVRQPKKGHPFSIPPIPLERGTPGSTIAGWMSLPWYGPEHLVLPGFESDGGNGLRRKSNGSDLFLASVGLMASGSRTILISRWNMAGANSLALTRNYAVRLPRMSNAQAFRESTKLAQSMDLNYEAEPRIKAKPGSPVLKASHPAFWAGNILMAIPAEPEPVAPPNVPGAPGANPPNVPGAPQLPGANPPMLPGGPGVNPPNVPGAPGANPPNVPGMPGANPPKLPDPPGANPPSQADPKDLSPPNQAEKETGDEPERVEPENKLPPPRSPVPPPQTGLLKHWGCGDLGFAQVSFRHQIALSGQPSTPIPKMTNN